MMGLWADGWFYISSAGLLVSGILFFFLIGQYRAASEAADATDGGQGAEKEAPPPAAIRPVYVPDEAAPSARISSHPPQEPEPAGATGGVSPAVVYLQNIKGELAELHQEMRSLAKRVDAELAAVSTRDEALVERLGELTRAVEDMKVPASPKARSAESVPEPAARQVIIEASTPAPVPQAAPEPARSPDETISTEPGALIAAPTAKSEQAPASAEPPPEEKTRRGPVWPV
ncbi:MAG: hypothetical protein HY403_10905 [Elusimicrobia bacterium]|nr:hypothetical protein [Elusimicrobiota bacterium]